MHVVATAGHVDHGKSTLVRALTGTDPDRLDEEKRRGLTIDLGFASTVLPSGETIAFIDVPGHIRFLKNMVAGVGAVEACVFVVDSSEGWRAQSEEHLRILEMFGVRHGVVVLTKIDLVDDDEHELVRLALAEQVEGSFLETAAVVAVDAVGSVGLDELRAALDSTIARTAAPVDRGRPRLWVDRAFSMDGAGTIVTGTLTLGSVRRGDELVVVPTGEGARVRRVQMLHEEVEQAPPGSRVALNLTGVDRAGLGRGLALVRPGQWHESSMVDASLDVLPALDHAVARRGSYLAYFGTTELAVDLRVLGDGPIRAGERGNVRLHLPHPLALLPGDRYLLRETGRRETVGGGEVLDVAPVSPANRARPDRSIERVIAERGWIDADELERLTGERRESTLGRWVVDPETVRGDESTLLDAIAASGPLGLEVASLDERQRALVGRLDHVIVDGSHVRLTSAPPPQQQRLLDALRSNLLSPPTMSEIGATPDEVRDLVQRGLVFREEGVYFAAEAADRAAEVIASLLDDKPEGVTVAEIRDAMGTSRKYVIALLARLDATGRTRRRGELRAAGPRLRPEPGSGSQ